MTKYEVLISETARKQLLVLDKKTRDRIKKSLGELGDDPFHSRSKADVKMLKGPKRDYWRLRVGDYRVIYTVDENRVLVARILHRRSAYSWLE